MTLQKDTHANDGPKIKPSPEDSALCILNSMMQYRWLTFLHYKFIRVEALIGGNANHINAVM